MKIQIITKLLNTAIKTKCNNSFQLTTKEIHPKHPNNPN